MRYLNHASLSLSLRVRASVCAAVAEHRKRCASPDSTTSSEWSEIA